MSVSMVTALLVGFLCCMPALAQYEEDYKEENSTCDRFVDVAIVGAGSSGAYSAYKLRHANLSVELIEYSNRTGGRIFSSFLPNTPDINIELGAMFFIGGKDKRVERLVRELDLTTTNKDDKPEERKFYVRGVTLTYDQVKYGNVPFDLTPEEKANQAELPEYYLRKLTGFNESRLRDEQVMNLKLKDGTPLYKLSTHQALDRVASPEGKHFLRAICFYDGLFAEDVSAVEYFFAAMERNETEKNQLTIDGGMSSLPKSLVRKFLEASYRHKCSFNKKLESIILKEERIHVLKLRETITTDEMTVPTKNEERVCAKKVILAIPHRALIELEWKPLRDGKVEEALSSVRPIKSGKVYLSFQKPWWLINNSTSFLGSDLPFNVMLDWKSSNITGEAVMLASCTDMYKAEFLENLNFEGKSIKGSAPGMNRVSTIVTQELLSHLSEAFDIPRKEIPEPKKGISHFWSMYPYGGGYTIWKAGYHHDDVRQTIEHPSLTDDVYIVGSDFARTMTNLWTEASLVTVDEVFEKYAI